MASEKTIDESAKSLIDKAKRDEVELVWDRFEKQGDKCNFGELGICCKNCTMGPCRLTHPSLPIYLRVGPHAAKAVKGVCETFQGRSQQVLRHTRITAGI
jgi:carbon-monoxide dehydrogenase catalytic subunit